MPRIQRLDSIVLDLIEQSARNSKTAPLNLGGVAGAGGGVGTVPGGFIGRLPQTRVAYDISEDETDYTPSSGMSLLDNLNHIRYRIGELEAGSGIGITLVDDNTSNTYGDIDTIHFSGGVIITDLGGGDALIVVSGGTSSGAETFLDLTDTPSSYSGQAGKAVVVNGAENALEFITIVASGVEEAPIDGNIYGRKDGGWTIASGGGGGAVDSVNGQTGIVVLSLDDIDDVDAIATISGQILVYNTSTEMWEARNNNHETLSGLLGGAANDHYHLTGTQATDLTDSGDSTLHYHAADRAVSIPLDGWIADANTWSYSSADSPTFVISINADVTALMGLGDRIKLTQTTAKYFIVTAVGAYSGGATLVTVYGGTDYTLVNAAITSPSYSHIKSPFGFPVNPDKWSVIVEDTNSYLKTNPVNGTWYSSMDSGTLPTIVLPIGSWRVYWHSALFAERTTSAYRVVIVATLSTANDSESDKRLTSFGSFAIPSAYTGDVYYYAPAFLEQQILVASKTTYYFIIKTPLTSQTYIGVDNTSTTVLKAVCSYL